MEVTATEDFNTDPAALIGGTFAHTSTSASFTCSKANSGYTQMGIEIVDGAGVVQRRKVMPLGGAMPLGATETATITGLTPGTAYKRRGYRGNVALTDI